MDDMVKFKDLFFETAFSHVEEAKNLIENLKADSSNKSLIGDLHIHMHSLKGEALAMNYLHFGEYLTLIEKYVKALNQGEAQLSDISLNIINNTILEAEGVLNYLKNNINEPEDINEKVDNLKKQIGNGI